MRIAGGVGVWLRLRLVICKPSKNTRRPSLRQAPLNRLSIIPMIDTELAQLARKTTAKIGDSEGQLERMFLIELLILLVA